jgi:hypothetical protein
MKMVPDVIMNGNGDAGLTAAAPAASRGLRMVMSANRDVDWRLPRYYQSKYPIIFIHIQVYILYVTIQSL